MGKTGPMCSKHVYVYFRRCEVDIYSNLSKGTRWYLPKVEVFHWNMRVVQWLSVLTGKIHLSKLQS